MLTECQLYLFDIVGGTPYTSSNNGKKAMLVFGGKHGMKDLFQHVRGVIDSEINMA